MKLPYRLCSGVLALALTLASPAPAYATMVVPVTVDALTRQSDDVIVATVLRGDAQWQGGRIVTDYQLRVSAVMKGSLTPGATTVLRMPGGVVGHIGQMAAGVAPLSAGASYMLFLSQGGTQGLRFLTHITASVLPIGTDPVSGDIVGTVPEGLIAVPAGAHPGMVALEAMDRAVHAVVTP